MELVYLPYENQIDVSATQHDHWTDKISQPLRDFLSNLAEYHLISEVKEEMIIELAPPENEQEITGVVFNETETHLDYLSNTQQDDLLSKLILQERPLQLLVI